MNICGIDPGYAVGAPGGIAMVRQGSHADEHMLVAAMPMPLMELPTSTRLTRHLRQCNLYAVTSILRELAPDIVVIELQGTRALQHAGRSFKAAVHYGSLIGVCCALDLPYELAAAHVWKPAMGLGHLDKNASLRRATELMPQGEQFWQRHKDHGTAEAALLAWWRAEHGHAAWRPRDTPSPRPRGAVRQPRRGMRRHRDQPRP